MKKATKLLIASQLVLAFSLALCTAILPQFLFSRNQGGIGNFALYTQTVIPFSFGFVGCAALIWWASTVLPKDMPRRTGIQGSLRLIAGLSLLVLCTTYVFDRSDALRNVHNYLSQALIVAEAWLVYVYAMKWARTPVNLVLAACFAAGFIAGVLTLSGTLHILFVAEIVTTFTFGASMVYTTYRLTSES